MIDNINSYSVTEELCAHSQELSSTTPKPGPERDDENNVFIGGTPSRSKLRPNDALTLSSPISQCGNNVALQLEIEASKTARKRARQTESE